MVIFVRFVSFLVVITVMEIADVPIAAKIFFCYVIVGFTAFILSPETPTKR